MYTYWTLKIMVLLISMIFLITLYRYHPSFNSFLLWYLQSCNAAYEMSRLVSLVFNMTVRLFSRIFFSLYIVAIITLTLLQLFCNYNIFIFHIVPKNILVSSMLLAFFSRTTSLMLQITSPIKWFSTTHSHINGYCVEVQQSFQCFIIYFWSLNS